MAHRVLVVDDEQELRRLIGLLLEKSGFDVLRAASAFEALDLLRESTPDLIILDVMMPDVDGIELCRQIRSRQQTARTPVLMLSARSEPKIVQSAFEAGASDYLSKPITPLALKKAVQDHLKTIASS